MRRRARATRGNRLDDRDLPLGAAAAARLRRRRRRVGVRRRLAAGLFAGHALDELRLRVAVEGAVVLDGGRAEPRRVLGHPVAQVLPLVQVGVVERHDRDARRLRPLVFFANPFRVVGRRVEHRHDDRAREHVLLQLVHRNLVEIVAVEEDIEPALLERVDHPQRAVLGSRDALAVRDEGVARTHRARLLRLERVGALGVEVLDAHRGGVRDGRRGDVSTSLFHAADHSRAPRVK